MAKVGEGARVVRFLETRLEVVERLGEAGDRRTRRTRRARGEDLVRERDETDAVARESGDRCERERGRDGIVELAAAAEARRHQPAAVEQQHHVLAALDFVLRDHELPAPRGGLPIDRAKRVAVAPFAQRLELGSGAAQLHPAQSRLDDAVAHVEPAVSLHGREVGIDADRLRVRRCGAGDAAVQAGFRTRSRGSAARRRRARSASPRERTSRGSAAELRRCIRRCRNAASAPAFRRCRRARCVSIGFRPCTKARRERQARSGPAAGARCARPSRRPEHGVGERRDGQCGAQRARPAIRRVQRPASKREATRSPRASRESAA